MLLKIFIARKTLFIAMTGLITQGISIILNARYADISGNRHFKIQENMDALSAE